MFWLELGRPCVAEHSICGLCTAIMSTLKINPVQGTTSPRSPFGTWIQIRAIVKMQYWVVLHMCLLMTSHNLQWFSRLTPLLHIKLIGNLHFHPLQASNQFSELVRGYFFTNCMQLTLSNLHISLSCLQRSLIFRGRPESLLLNLIPSCLLGYKGAWRKLEANAGYWKCPS